MDALSEVLRSVKLQGALFFHGEFSAPWCFRSGAAPGASALLPMIEANPGRPTGPVRLLIFHFLTEGRAFARLPGGKRLNLDAGDIVIVPHGDEHLVGNGAPEKPVDSFQVFAGSVKKGLKAVRFGGGGEVTRFVCGFMTCEARLSEVFLSGLPPLLKVPIATGGQGEWLAQSIRFAVRQAAESSSGSGVVLAKLAEILFIEALRRYVAALPERRRGWLAGARDPAVGKAMSAMHRQPQHAWTVAALARTAGTSRTRLMERFRRYLGASPIAYLAKWRMMLGAELLQSTTHSVAEVAMAVGYGSEAAFNRAFKRAFRQPPARFRRGVSNSS